MMLFSFFSLPSISSSHSFTPTSHGSCYYRRPVVIFLPALLELNKPYCHFIHLLSGDFLSLKEHFLKMCSIWGKQLCLFFSCHAATELIFPHIGNGNTYGNKDDSPVKYRWVYLATHCLVTK